MTEKIQLSWKIINEHIDTLCERVRQSGVPYKAVVGIQRGGLNISIPLAEKIGVKHRSIKISFYDGDKKRKEPVVDIFDLDIRETPILLVDDLIDSGETLKYFAEMYKFEQGVHFDTAVVYWNQKNQHGIKPTYHAEEKPKAWLEFPWELQ